MTHFSNAENTWQHVLRDPQGCDHIVQVYEDRTFLAEAVAEYIGTGLRRHEAAIVIARPTHADAFRTALKEAGCSAAAAIRDGKLVMRDAQQTLSKFMVNGLRGACSRKASAG